VADWIDQFVEMNWKGYHLNENRLRVLPPEALGLPRSAVTGKDGRFRLPGVGRDRVVTVILRGERTAAVRLQVVTREGPRAGWVKGDHGLYPSGFTYLLAPTKPIVGTVRDRKTGKPVVGVTVSDGNYYAQATTDEKGQYRIIGAPKQPSYRIALGGRKGVPYLGYTRFGVPDTPGLEPLRVDFELERGVEISGRVLDKVTGKPARGEVRYFHTRDNPNLKDFPTLDGLGFIVSDWGRIRPDGSFTVLGIPGPGALVVLARDSTRYQRVDAVAGLRRLKVGSFPVGATHAVLPINASEKEPKTLSYTLFVTPARSRPVRLTGPDGKPVTGARAAGLTDDSTVTQLSSDRLTLGGLRRDGDRALVVIHERRQLGAVAAVCGDSDEPLEVKLEPLGAVTGRLVNQEGKPLAGRTVALSLWLDPKRFENLPDRFVSLGRFGGPWQGFTMRTAKTDKDGRFRVGGLLPGQRYDLDAGEGDLLRRENRTHRSADLRVGPGKTKDVGDVEPTEPG
jgi:hypothetical protein